MVRWRIPLILFAVALGIRVLVLLCVFDAAAAFPKYLELALRLCGRVEPSVTVFYSSPLYTVLLALLHCWLQLPPLAIKLLQLAVGSCNVVLVYLLGTTYFDRRTGMLAGCLACVYGPLLLHDAALLTAVWVCLFNLGALLLLGRYVCRGRLRALGGAGLLLGLSIITRPSALLLAALLLPVVLLAHRDASLRTRALAGIVLCAAMAAPVLPVTVWNWKAGGEFIPVTNAGGWVFYCANNRQATGLGFYPPPELMVMGVRRYLAGDRHLGYTEHLDSVAIARQHAGRALSHAGVGRYWWRRGWAEISSDWHRSFVLLGAKARYLVNTFEAHDTVEAIRDSYRLARFPVLTFGAVLALACVGLVCVGNTAMRLRLLLAGYLGGYVLFFLLFYMIPRFRVPMEAVLLVPAARGVVVLVEFARARRLAALVCAGCMVLVLSLVATRTDAVIATHRDVAMPAAVRLYEAMHLLRTGNPRAAAYLLERNLQANPADQAARLALQRARQHLSGPGRP